MFFRAYNDQLSFSVLLLVCSYLILCSCSNETVEESEENQNVTAINIYRKLLRHKRKDQQEAIKKLMSLDNMEKQIKVVKMLLEKVVSVLEENKITLLNYGYTPGDPFPEAEHIKEALSMVVENTAFAGDLVLYLPDISHQILKQNNLWDITIKWFIGYVNESDILVGTDAKLLNLAAQELEIIPQTESYHNPYKSEEAQQYFGPKTHDKGKKEEEKKAPKKKKKERPRGPRLQGGRNEL